MSTPCVVVRPEQSLEECCKVMEAGRLRRIPVIDETGKLCGIISLADIAKNASDEATGGVMKEISQPTESASRVI